MILGIAKEGEVLKGIEEKRVGLSPAGVQELVSLGASVYVTSGAGFKAGFLDGDYTSAGAQIAYSSEEAIRRADLVLQIGRPSEPNWAFFNRGSALFSFLHLGAPCQQLVRMLVEKEMTAVGYENVRAEDGSLPLLKVSSEIAGKMSVQLAGRLLESTSGGRGVLLGGIPGIPPADVIILGGGTVGYYAARSFLGIGASVYILDCNLQRLQTLDRLFRGRVVTALANRSNIEKHISFADVLIACVRVPGQRAPVLVTEAMIERMSPGSVIIDFSIDQGGCVETSRLAPAEDFFFTRHSVAHFCAPNVPAMVARTSTYGLTNSLLPYLRAIVKDGLTETLKNEKSLCRGLYTFRGFASDSLAVAEVSTRNLERMVYEMG